MSTISHKWADFAYSLRYDDIPTDAVQAAKNLMYDSFGCALGGSLTDDFRILTETFLQIGGKGKCTVIGTDISLDVRSASLINGVAIRALDYNDVYWRQDPSHPSDLLPAAFCTGESLSRCGKELIVATVIAYELEMRIMEAAFPGLREVGLHHASLTAFVSPLVAGRMLELSIEEMVHAVGISGSHNITLGAVTSGALTMMKNTVDPMATEAGVFAALLAKKGYKGPADIFEGREGLFRTIGESWDPKVLTDELGTKFKIVDCSIKPFPSEALTHAPISAVLDLVQKHDLKPSEIESIEIHTLKRAAEILADEKKYIIDSRETADHSLPYCIAASVVKRELTPKQFSKESLNDPIILGLVPKVKAILAPDFESRFPIEQPCRVIVKLVNGNIHETVRNFPKGDPRDPLSVDELQGKFSQLANGVITQSQQMLIYNTLNNLENLDDIGDLMKLLRASS